MYFVRFYTALLMLFVALGASGCAGHGSNGVERFGQGVLDTIGVSPGATRFNADEQLHSSIIDLSPEEENELGRAVAARILSKFTLVKDPQAITYLNKVGHAVVAFSDLPETFAGYHFALIDDPEPNAVSAPGGIVFISTGLLNALSDEDTLAAILAHEVSHVARHHGVRSLSKDNLSKAVSAAGVVVGSLSCNEILREASVAFGAAVDQLVDVLLVKGYSREFEYEADRSAHTILARSGYEPKAMVDALNALDRVSLEQQNGGWFSTHPSTSERRAALGNDQNESNHSARLIRSKRFLHEINKDSSKGQS